MSYKEEQPILDHGYVKYINHYGSEEEIIEAARMSTGKGFLGWGPVHEPGCAKTNKEITDIVQCVCTPKEGDEKLLSFLWKNKHTSPFEMADIVIEVKAPIFVFREWHRHRTQSYNEMSARYTPLPDENYVPSIERLMINAGTSNKQAGTIKDARELTKENAEEFRRELIAVYDDAEILYQTALNSGVPKELARLMLPVARYSRMRAKANLLNWLKFMTLRCAPGAQWEIRQYADAVANIVKDLFPRVYELWNEENAR